ncbi:hypothetical protein DOTSEDRAFT_30116 [Dothistroma septosporum NZE10]|uniref:SMP domain-containing protein n=1 Tax=Dothistroma septosporum (strain NZE10 / CBS 128990) TaxID=675120 RepID=N1Q0D7_DOTSN|nr:hypothetical protein DOTSEDRAFT_30116 [Dothistroma septosporum NZE10]
MSDHPFHVTKEDVRKVEQQASKLAGGDVPADSDAAALQSIVDQANKNKGEIIAERQGNLPLPDQPPQASDFNSADARTVNVGSGGISGGQGDSKGADGLRGPATGGSVAREDPSVTGGNVQGVGRGTVDGGLPNDAVTREKKHVQGLADTTNKDYGYPQKNDPTSK